MIRIVLTRDGDVLGTVATNIEAFPQRFQDRFVQGMPTLTDTIRAITSITPGPPSYPLTPKMTPRQRQAFFATNGFGRGIPTPRVQEPGGVLGAFNVTLTRTSDGGTVLVTNDYPGAVYIVGEEQQPFHADTGWIKVDTVQPANEAASYDYLQVALDDVLF